MPHTFFFLIACLDNLVFALAAPSSEIFTHVSDNVIMHTGVLEQVDEAQMLQVEDKSELFSTTTGSMQKSIYKAEPCTKQY